MDIRAVRAELWSMPLRAPFAISQRTAYTAENVFIFVDIAGQSTSLTGVGASAPVAYVTGETTDTVLAAVDALKPTLIGSALDDLDPLLILIKKELSHAPAARAGVEMAIFDAWSKASGVSLWRHFGAAAESVDTDITIPITSADAAGVLARDAIAAGFKALKIKVGSCDGPDADLDRVRAVVDAAPHARLRIDANQAFSPTAAIDFTHRLAATGAIIELIEQPVPRTDIDGLKSVRDAIDYPVFADEAACSPNDVRKLIARDAVDGVNIKLMKSGITGALEIIELCRDAGKKLMIGCMLETELGIAAAAQFTAGTGAFDHVDLDSHRLLSPVPQIRGGLGHDGEKLIVDEEQIRAAGFGWGVTVDGKPSP